MRWCAGNWQKFTCIRKGESANLRRFQPVSHSWSKSQIMMRMLDNAVEKIENRFCGRVPFIRNCSPLRHCDNKTLKMGKDKKCLVKCCLKMNWIGKQRGFDSCSGRTFPVAYERSRGRLAIRAIFETAQGLVGTQVGKPLTSPCLSSVKAVKSLCFHAFDAGWWHGALYLCLSG